MTTHNYSSPEAHVAANAHADLRIKLLLHQPRALFRISSLVLRDLKVQWGQGAGCTLTEGAVSPGGGVIFLATQNASVMRVNGHRLDPQTFRLQLPGDELDISSTEPHSWFSMSIPEGMLRDWTGIDRMAKTPSSRFVRIPRERAEMFQRAVAHLGAIAEQAPDAFKSSIAVKTTARKLTELVRESIWGTTIETTPPGRQSIPRMQIVRAVMESVDRRDNEYVTVPDLASAACISERTLRAAFQEYFGMGPLRYLKLRTLNLAHKALQNPVSSGTSITSVATDLGIWELGRFARDYKVLFGELPSETLRSAQ